MRPDYYGGYTTHLWDSTNAKEGGVICKDCAGDLTEDEEKHLGYFPIFASSEWDYYPSCDICGKELDYVRLTSEGREYEEKMNNKRRKKR